MDSQQRLTQAKQRIDAMSGLPDQTKRSGRVDVGDSLTGKITYTWDMIRDRDSKSLTFYYQYVDLDGSGHREVLPNKVIVAMFRAYDSLITKSRKLSAKERIQKAKANGTYKPPTWLNGKRNENKDN
jgi:hypothetical protein